MEKTNYFRLLVIVMIAMLCPIWCLYGCRSADAPAILPGSQSNETQNTEGDQTSTAPIGSTKPDFTSPSSDSLISGNMSPQTQSPTQVPFSLPDLADNQISAERLITKRYSINPLLSYTSHNSIVATSLPLDAGSLNQYWKMECIRTMESGRHYSLVFTENGGRQFLFFDENQKLDYALYLHEPLRKEGFLSLKSGDPYKKVLEVDSGLQEGFNVTHSMNTIQAADYDYTLHLFADSLLVIAWGRTNVNMEDADSVLNDKVIHSLQWVDDYQVTMEAYGGKTWDFRILPMDYPR